MGDYSMLVVDDEQLAREYVVNLFDWNKLGISTLYEADNCYAAISIIEQHQPEIIFLDIRLPEMSGVDLLFVLQQKNIDTEVIVLSGYSDFESARKMLKTGKVVEYLLKPVSEDLVAEAVVRSISNIEKKRSLAKMQGLYSKVIENEKRRMYQSYIFGMNYEPDDVVEPAEQYRHMQIGVIYCEQGLSVLREVCADMINYALTSLRDIMACEQPNHYALFFASIHSDKTAEEVYRILSYTCEKTDSYSGCGRAYGSVLDLNASYRQALFACESRLFVKQRVISIDEISSIYKSSLDRDEMVKRMTSYVRASQFDRIDELIKQILQTLLFEQDEKCDGNTYDVSVCKAYFAYLLESVMPERKRSINLSFLFSARNINGLYDIVRNTLHQACGYYSQDRTIQKINLVQHAKQFIEKNYMNPITLNQVADIVFINPSYLSRLFSEIEGSVFTDYIVQIRITEAKKLLMDRKYKIYEVADMVGYKNFKYFLKVFKEKEGLTPAQYREKRIYSQSISFKDSRA